MRRLLICSIVLATAACAGDSESTVTEALPLTEPVSSGSNAPPLDDGQVRPEESTTTAPLTPDEEGRILLEDEPSATQEEVDAFIAAGDKDDVSIEVVLPEATQTISVELSGVKDSGFGDGLVANAQVIVEFDPGAISFAQLPDGCSEVSESQIRCLEGLLDLGRGSGAEPQVATFALPYGSTLAAGQTTTVFFEASSNQNPATNDPDPTNNTANIEITMS